MKESNNAHEDSSEESREEPPKPLPGMRERGNAMRKSLQKDMRRSELLSRSVEQLLSQPEIETLLAPTGNGTENVPSIESLLFNNKTVESMLLKHKRNTATNRPPSEKDSKELQSFNKNRKMPASWIVNLRRALYQSMDSLINAQRKQSSGSTNDETIEAKSSNINPNTRSSSEVYRTKVTELWDKLRGANLTLVEPLSRSATELPETVYLPEGEGPIASGVVVNTRHGIQLRMASELYFQQDEPDHDPSAASDNNCNCHLINNGEMLMAYWAVSRIANENGQPALQYLIYPLPHNVPTPPRLIPFNQYTFNPSSQFNPNAAAAVAGNRKVSNRHNQQQQQQQLAQHHLAQDQVQLQPYPQLPHGQLGHVKQLAGGLPPNYEAVIPQLQEIPIDPSQLTRPAISQQQPQTTPDFQNILNGFQYFTQIPQYSPQPADGGVLIQNQHGYTPEFVDAYKQAVLHHLHQQGHPQLHPQQLNPQVQVVQKQVRPSPPPAHVQLFDGKSSGFPKSIQDILNPVQQQQQQIHPGQFPGSFPPGQVQTVGGFEHIPAAGPPASQEYHGVLNHQQHSLQQPGISPHKLGDVVNYYSFDHNPPTGTLPYDTTINHHPDQHLQHHPDQHSQHHPDQHLQHHPDQHSQHHPNQHLQHHPDQHSQHLQPDPYLGDGPYASSPYPNRPTNYAVDYRQPHSLGNRFAGSIRDEYHHRTQNQQLPTRHRSEKYPRPPITTTNSKQFNSDGSYIINF